MRGMQIDLFTKRTRKGPAPLEFPVHCAIADTIRLSLSPGWVWFHVPNGEERGKAAAGRLKRMGELPGVSDFILIAPPAGRIHALELKRRGVKPSEDQMAFLNAVGDAGGAVAWVDSYDDALITLKEWGAVRVTLTEASSKLA